MQSQFVKVPKHLSSSNNFSNDYKCKQKKNQQQIKNEKINILFNNYKTVNDAYCQIKPSHISDDLALPEYGQSCELTMAKLWEICIKPDTSDDILKTHLVTGMPSIINKIVDRDILNEQLEPCYAGNANIDWLEVNVTRQLWLLATQWQSTAENFAQPEGSSTCAEITTHGAHGLTSLAEDGACERCLPPKHRWCTWLVVEPKTLRQASQHATNNANMHRTCL